jgi:hypothetical protein
VLEGTRKIHGIEPLHHNDKATFLRGKRRACTNHPEGEFFVEEEEIVKKLIKLRSEERSL